MNEAHEQLMKKVHEYYKVNQIWESKRTHTAGIQVRKILTELRHLARARREEIQEIRVEKPKVKSPAYRKSLLQAPKDQND